MRSCDEIVDLISASLDGELSADEQTALDEHIACCPACSALLDDLRALHIAAADWEDVPAPAGFAEAVMDAIAAEAEPQKTDNVISFAPRKAKVNYWKKWGVTAAAFAIVVLGAVSAPSLLGNFSATKADNDAMAYTADCAMPEMAEDDSRTDADHYGMNTNSEVEDSPAEMPAPSAQTEVKNSAPLHFYVGELVLEEMLDALENCEGAASSDGTVTYLVSAELFDAILQELEDNKPVGYSYTAGDASAELGRIIVQSN